MRRCLVAGISHSSVSTQLSHNIVMNSQGLQLAPPVGSQHFPLQRPLLVLLCGEAVRPSPK